jgi:hypothetical protein
MNTNQKYLSGAVLIERLEHRVEIPDGPSDGETTEIGRRGADHPHICALPE